jgi:hypothetical protein
MAKQMSKRFESVFRSSIAVALIWLGGLGCANALTIRGSLAPVFSGSYTDLYWTAQIEFDVSAACLSSHSGPVDTATTADCAVSNYSLVADLKYTQPSPGTITQTIPISFAQTIPDITLDIVGGVVQSIGTPQIGPSSQWNFSSPVQGQGYAWIQFFNSSASTDSGSMSSADLLLQFCTTPSPIVQETSAPLFLSPECEVVGCSADPNQAQTSTRASVQVSQVPEPGSLWLMTAALAMGLFVPRRNRLR